MSTIFCLLRMSNSKARPCMQAFVSILLYVNLSETNVHFHGCKSPPVAALISVVAKHPEQLEEQVDDVQVQVERCKNVIINGELYVVTLACTKDALCVIDDE